jgi:hypothetical protein
VPKRRCYTFVRRPQASKCKRNLKACYNSLHTLHNTTYCTFYTGAPPSLRIVITHASADAHTHTYNNLNANRPFTMYTHRCHQDRELKRIEAAGGFVNAVGRVNGNLNLSRSLGDLKYKQVPYVPPADQV